MLRIRHNACPLCGGDLHPLGSLGNLEHYRCRQCGIGTSREKRAKPLKGEALRLEMMKKHTA